MPSSSGSAMAGCAALAEHALVLLLEAPLLDLVADQELGVADVLDAHAAQHLPDDHLDVLVVDAHALQPVDLLDLVHQVLGQRLLAEDGQDVVRVRASRPSAARRRVTKSPSCTLMCLPLGIRYSRDSPTSGVTMTLRLPLVSLPKETCAVDLRHDRELLRLARLEQLGHARQAAGDVLRLGGLARDLGDDVARRDRPGPRRRSDVRADRESGSAPTPLSRSWRSGRPRP